MILSRILLRYVGFMLPALCLRVASLGWKCCYIVLLPSFAWSRLILLSYLAGGTECDWHCRVYAGSRFSITYLCRRGQSTVCHWQLIHTSTVTILLGIRHLTAECWMQSGRCICVFWVHLPKIVLDRQKIKCILAPENTNLLQNSRQNRDYLQERAVS